MNNEFTVKKTKNQTTYTLESATGGGTSSGSVASVSQPLGGVRKRDNILAQETGKKTVPKPRHPVPKTGGAGQHADKKKAQKQGQEKHKKPVYEDHEIQMASSELQSISKEAGDLLKLIKHYSEQEGLEAWQQSKITKAADYLHAVLQSLNGEQHPAEGYKVVPGIDREKYTERPGLEGPFHARNGKVVYYDKKEGKYYDPSSDFYIDHDEWEAMNREMSESSKQRLDPKCWAGKHKEGTKMKGNVRVNNCVPNESTVAEAHGDPRDKGAADAWYHRPYRNPFPKGSPEHAEYTAGFDGEEEGSAGGKQYDRSSHPHKQHSDRGMDEATLDEKAPPGMEAVVMRLKKQYPGEPEKAFATAWSIYNKKHGKKKESTDSYFESLEMALERQLEPNMPLGSWEKNFLNANPYRYRQFKNKTPAKKK